MVEVVDGDPGIWLLDDIEEVCAAFESETGHPAQSLMWAARVHVHYRPGVVDVCGHAPACTVQTRYPHRYHIHIATHPGAPKRLLLQHEIAHVLLFQAGHRGGTHHPLMRRWGLCYGHCPGTDYALPQTALP